MAYDEQLENREEIYRLLKKQKLFKGYVEKVRAQLQTYRTALLSCLLFGCNHTQLFDLTVSIGRVLYLYRNANDLPFIVAHDFLFYDKLLKSKRKTKKLYKQLTKEHSTDLPAACLTTPQAAAAYEVFVKSIYIEFQENGIARPPKLREFVDELRRMMTDD